MPNTTNFDVDEHLFPLEANAAVMDVFVADLNGDGYDDVILTYFFYPMEDRAIPMTILFGAADGSLTEADASFFIGGAPENVWGRQIIVADFNEDGRPDIYVADHGYDTDPFPGAQNTLLLSTADGTHMVNATANLPQLTDFSHSAAVGDFNGDQHLDLFVNNYNGNGIESHYLLLGDGTGGFTQDFSLPADVVAGNWNSPASGVIDYDGDGDLDIVMTPNFTDEQDIRILINDGTGDFSGPSAYLDIAPIGVRDSVVDFVVADLNGDGLDDMIMSIAADYYASQGYVSIFINHGNGVFVDETAARIDAVGAPGWIQRNQLIDINGDGHLDIVQLKSGGTSAGPILLNNGEGLFIRMPSDFSGGHDAFTGAYEHDRVMGGDIDNDGRTDLVALRFHDGTNYWTAVHRAIDPGAEQVGNEQANGLMGDGSAETLSGGVGNDVIFAAGGEDRLFGESGDDKLVGGADNDLLDGGDGRDWLWGNEGNDLLRGQAGGDLLSGGAGDDSLKGGSGKDQLSGDAGADKIRGNGGDDTLAGGDGGDQLYGGGGSDVVRGGADDDTLAGGGAGDKLYGDGGNDQLSGNGGSDRLDGGAGDDMLAGGSGTDLFYFAAGSGQDTILDFQDGDTIAFDATLGLEFADLVLTSEGDATVVTWGTDDSITVLGDASGSLSASDFWFGASDPLAGLAASIEALGAIADLGEPSFGGFDAKWGGEGMDAAMLGAGGYAAS